MTPQARNGAHKIKESWLTHPEVMSSSMDGPKYEEMLDKYPWAESFEAYCDHVEDIAQYVEDGGWTEEEAGVISFCATSGVTIFAATQVPGLDHKESATIRRGRARHVL